MSARDVAPRSSRSYRWGCEPRRLAHSVISCSTSAVDSLGSRLSHRRPEPPGRFFAATEGRAQDLRQLTPDCVPLIDYEYDTVCHGEPGGALTKARAHPACGCSGGHHATA